MVTSSYPRFPGDTVGTFMEPIAQGVAARGHEVHVVVPWHPRWSRDAVEGGVHFHPFRYSPTASLNVFGYAAALRADVRLRTSAVAIAPLALLAGWRCARLVARQTRASIMHGHWVIPGGAIAAAAAGRVPLVVSLHGSDVFVAEQHAVAGRVARSTFRRAAWVTACSEDLRARAVRLGAREQEATVVPYGVDSGRFKPDVAARARGRASLGIPDDVPVVVALGRLVRKKGFEYLIDAAAILKLEWPGLRVVIAGEGDLDTELRSRAQAAGVAEHVRFVGVVPHDMVPALLAAADVAVAPSVRDGAGNVDGLPNTVMEIMASGTPLVTTTAGGIGAVATDGRTARVVPERDVVGLAAAIGALLQQPALRASMGREGREMVCRDHSWSRVAEEFEAIYERIAV